MTLRAATTVAGVSLLVAALTAFGFFALPRALRTPATTALAAVPAGPAPPGRKIKARLFYVSEDGTHLVGVERDVPFAEGVEQAREIIAAQLAPVTEPLVSAMPPGTSLRAIYITDRGDAYVDLGHEVVDAHPGGTSNELLTVYTIVDALTANLPGVQAVQILVDGKEAPTLAGHVDLRQPLAKNLALVQ